MRALAPGNPMARALPLHLAFEAVVFGLAVPGMILVDGVDTGLALGAGGAAVALAIVAAATLRRPFGWWLGWATQVVAVLLGLLTPWMWALGALFAGLYVLMYVLGRRLDAQRVG